MNLEKLNPDKCLLVYTNCMLVRGYSRSVIMDLQLGEYELIPNSLYDILIDYNKRPIKNLIRKSSAEDLEIVEEYFHFLTSRGYITWIDDTEIDYFPPLDPDFHRAEIITNSIIESAEKYISAALVDELDDLMCNAVVLKFSNQCAFNSIDYCLNLFSRSTITDISINLQYTKQLIVDDLINVIEKYNRVRYVLIYGASGEDIIDLIHRNCKIIIVKDDFSSAYACGFISHDYFTTNLPFYTESLQHNTCLNRKISIDVNGEIKNCPGMTKSYGNIKDTTLVKAIEKPGFKDVWYIHKDQISVCKDCEFRHICTDCRAYVEDIKDEFSKPLKCGYNPYTCEWEEWSKNPLKQQAIEHYSVQQLKK